VGRRGGGGRSLPARLARQDVREAHAADAGGAAGRYAQARLILLLFCIRKPCNT